MSESLYTQIYDWDNMLLAHRKASKGKRGKEPAARFEYHLEDNLIALRDELRTRTYRPGPYDSFYIHEAKRRLISAAPFRDRVVHHALCNVTEPIFERSFIYDSYANRVGKGHHFPLQRAGNARRPWLPGRGSKAGAVRSWPRPGLHLPLGWVRAQGRANRPGPPPAFVQTRAGAGAGHL